MARKKLTKARQAMVKHYSGPASTEFWRRIRHLQEPYPRALCLAGCLLQDAEARVLAWLADAEHC